MRGLWRSFRRVPLSSWAWVNFKVVLGFVYPVLAVFNNPLGVGDFISHPLLLVWLGCINFGAVASIVGIILSSQPGKRGVFGVSVELIGLIFLFLGPLMITITYLSYGRLTSAALAWAIGSAVMARGLVVAHRFRKEAHDESKAA